MGNFVDPPSGSADVECQLLEAAKAGDSEQVQRLLTSYPQIVNCRDLDGRWVYSDILDFILYMRCSHSILHSLIHFLENKSLRYL